MPLFSQQFHATRRMSTSRRTRVRQRFEQRRVHDGEHHGVGADGEQTECDTRKAARPRLRSRSYISQTPRRRTPPGIANVILRRRSQFSSRGVWQRTESGRRVCSTAASKPQLVVRIVSTCRLRKSAQAAMSVA
jgi:hypothetical protein